METSREAIQGVRVNPRVPRVPRIPRLRVVMLSDVTDRLAVRSSKDPTTLFMTSNCYHFARNGATVEVTLPVGRVLLLLASSQGQVTLHEVIECLWGNRLDGGPDSGECIARQIVAKANVLAAALGLTVTSRYQRGWEFRDLQRSTLSDTTSAPTTPA